ncbi:MAG: class I SAM-dependent methyltransferase [Chitinispirillales bacterium]|jgi:hypothetical protein|nr:class I SAM-dependent methyltransferase [Chitinispirillales bacterium]
MLCKICNCESKNIFNGKILGKYETKYFHCEKCGFLFAEDPERWLEHAYKESIASMDTGIMLRNNINSRKLSILLYFFLKDKENSECLDYAGGYGIFTRLLRDVGFNFYWQDKYTKNLMANGFEGDLNKKYEVCTCFECFEHLVLPLQEIETILKLSDTLIFSTILLPEPIPVQQDWWYYAPQSGQHISFYSEKTLRFIAKSFGLEYLNIFGFHIFTELRQSLILKRIDIYIKPSLMQGVSMLYDKIRKKMQPKTIEDMNMIIRRLLQ